MDGHKRKRDDDGTVVTFYAPDRTFQRVYKGQSLDETRTLVRAKLGLPDDASIRFSRLHEGKHIDLEDDDDFEAFRHLARYVPTLDVSVFVGNDRPPIFTQRSAQGPSGKPLSRKQSRKNQDSRPSTAFSEPVSGRSTPASVVAIPRAPSSTLDGNGVPQKKRKRKEEPLPRHLGLQVLPADGSQADESSQTVISPPKASSSKKKSRKGSKSSAEARESDTVAPASSARASDTPAPVVGSKRKRHESPDIPVATTSRETIPVRTAISPAPRSPPPSPVKKKRKRDKRASVADDGILTDGQSSAPAPKPSKKGKKKAIAESGRLQEGDVADTEDNAATDGAAKKAKKEKRAKKKVVSADVDSPADAQAPSTSSHERKGKGKEVEKTSGVAAPPVDVPGDVMVAAAQPSSTEQVPKDTTGAAKSTEIGAQLASAAGEPAVLKVITDAVITSAENGKRKRGRKSKAIDSVEVQSEIPAAASPNEAAVAVVSSLPEVAAEAVQKENKRKRRKTLAADTSLDPDVSTISSTTVPNPAITLPEEIITPVAPSSAAQKRGRKKSIAPATSQTSDSASAMAAVQAAWLAVLARNSAASAAPAPSAPVPEESVSQPAAEPALPARKRKTGKSKLHQTWGPEDIEGEEQASVSVSAAGQDTVASAQPADVSSPRSISVGPAQTPVKTVKAKAKGAKVRPSSAPACPICEKASNHSRSDCPVVQGGPETIRSRIAQLKSSGHDKELVDELEVLLKEALRRRKSVGGRQLSSLPAPNEATAIASTSGESTPSPAFPLSAASFAARPSPLPRVPAGSEISEVAVESKDEGSSNESSSDDDEEAVAGASTAPSASIPMKTLINNLGLADIDALIRGPVKPRGSILDQIPSHSSSENEHDSADDKDDDVDLEEEEKHDRAYRRMSRKLQRAASSSDDEPEPEPDAEPDANDADAVADGQDAVVPPTFMDVTPNDAIGQGSDAEWGGIVSNDVTGPGDASDESADEQPAEEIAPDAHSKAGTDQGYESDAEEVAAPQPPVRQGQADSEPEPDTEGEAQEDEEAPSALRDEGSDNEHSADISGRASSPHITPEQLAEEDEEAWDPEANEDEYEGEEIPQEDREAVPQEAEGADEPLNDDSASEDDKEVEQNTALTASATRALSLEVGQTDTQPVVESPSRVNAEAGRTPSPPPLPQPATAHADVDMSTGSVHLSEFDLRPVDQPSDPIESLGSFADVSEQRQAVDDDPIEDPDADIEPVAPHSPTVRAGAELARLQETTPPPAVPRTPGTVSRMKNRHGRLVTMSPSKMLPSLSQQILGPLAPALLATDVESEAQVHEPAPVPTQQAEDEPQEVDDVPTEHSQQVDEEADEVQQLETRPRRTTRVTRRVSAMTQSSVGDFPASTPTPTPAPPATEPSAAPKRRAARLTVDEKAAREAEKKADRERKAAERKAEREAKAAEKKAEKEAKEAAKRAEKEAKEALKLAAQAEKEKEKVEDRPKRGRGRPARGRGAAAKPTSTRSRATASADADEPDEDQQAQGPTVEATAEPSSSTPGFSKVAWATLPSTQPRTQTESVVDVESSMVDELQPSSPGSPSSRSPEPISRTTNTTNTTEKDEADVSREVTITQDRADGQPEDSLVPFATPKPNGRTKDALFIPSSSQFPSTPFPDDGLPESTPRVNGYAYANDIGSDGADGVAQDSLEPLKSSRNGWSRTAPFQRLSDIASQALFSRVEIPSPMLFPSQSQSQQRQSNASYGRRDDDDDDSDDSSGSGSDSDAEVKKSHIPRERRAGAGVQKKKRPLLS